jgi:glyoxylase-like metal-dependent hydrolase (beta-lactamase superfamily II)/8-oxo-dGTP pyrophosphatase MutT (NUDIX family)
MTTKQTPTTPRPAATLVLVRDGAQGIEVFMMQRTHQADFVAGAYVFPGGGVDLSDAHDDISACCAGLDDAAASRALLLDKGGLAYWIAAIRESFEEAGLLFAYDQDGELVGPRNAALTEALPALREKLNSGELSLLSLCRDYNLKLAVDKMVYFSHWVTPPGLGRRYDTRFFIGVAPEGQTGTHDNAETIDNLWIRPADALALQREGKLSMVFATIKTLTMLSAFSDTQSLMAHMRALQGVKVNLPVRARGRKGPRVLLPEDHAYAEVCKLDAIGEGTVLCEIEPGTVARLSDRVRRITAPNPGFMTGPGTNTYLIGDGEDIAVIDPGPADAQHIQNLVAQAGGRIRWIFATHTHIDHSPGATLLKAATGAELLGLPAPPHERQDQQFKPDRRLEHGQRLQVAGVTLRVVHTPGHASNHLCYLLEEERILFTGDHIMQGSTVVINPPDGDMLQYLASLNDLKALNAEYLAPGHGFLMARPDEMVDRLVAHRLAREAKVLGALKQQGECSLEQLLPAVYADVPAQRHGMAARSLLAHLLKLKADGAAIENDGAWRAA